MRSGRICSDLVASELDVPDGITIRNHLEQLPQELYLPGGQAIFEGILKGEKGAGLQFLQPIFEFTRVFVEHLLEAGDLVPVPFDRHGLFPILGGFQADQVGVVHIEVTTGQSPFLGLSGQEHLQSAFAEAVDDQACFFA